MFDITITDQGMVLTQTRTHPNCQTKLTALLTMNARNSVTFVQIQTLPESSIPCGAELQLLEFFLATQVGGTIIVTGMPAGHLRIDTVDPDLLHIDKNNLRYAIMGLETHIDVNCHSQNPNIATLTTAEDYQHLNEALFTFKRDHSNFVTEDKIEAGLYSAEAEKIKLGNAGTKHFSFYDMEEKKFLACVQVFTQNNIAYVSDLIVHRQHRNKKMAQALCLVAYHEIVESYPHLKTVIFEKTIDLPSQLYQGKLPSKVLNEDEQMDLGIHVYKLPAKTHLLKAANRSLQSPHTTLDQSEYAGLATWGFFAGMSVIAVGAAAVYFSNRQP